MILADYIKEQEALDVEVNDTETDELKRYLTWVLSNGVKYELSNQKF